MRRPLYAGALQAHVIGSFVRLGETFHVIHPGYDLQGRRRQSWTQVVHDDVPIWEHRLSAPKTAVLARFIERFNDTIGDDAVLLGKALKSCKAARRARFMDGASGVEPAPTLADGRADPLTSS